LYGPDTGVPLFKITSPSKREYEPGPHTNDAKSGRDDGAADEFTATMTTAERPTPAPTATYASRRRNII
jgi:hypothetical protein